MSIDNIGKAAMTSTRPALKYSSAFEAIYLPHKKMASRQRMHCKLYSTENCLKSLLVR